MWLLQQTWGMTNIREEWDHSDPFQWEKLCQEMKKIVTWMNIMYGQKSKEHQCLAIVIVWKVSQC